MLPKFHRFRQVIDANRNIGTTAPHQRRSEAIKRFQSESPHEGTYLARTVTTQSRTASIAAKLDEVLGRFDSIQIHNDIIVPRQ